jgi:hypothetical protein
MPYTINFSDPSKTNLVTVPDMPPGVNTVDTSLTLVGRGYPNYGLKIAENFVHLLENFASALPPENPIEGQLWYDTSDPNNKVLRIMDGTASATRWPSANGIYQQGTDPRYSNNLSASGLKSGDIWVDTANNQLKIYSNNGWSIVGPQFSDGALRNGPNVATYKDTKTPPNEYTVVEFWAEGQIEAIVSSVAFTPRSVIDGFSTLLSGVNIRSDGTFNGKAISAQNLLVNSKQYGADRFLRKDDTSVPTISGQGQIITGRVLWQTPVNAAGSQGRDGIVITNSSTPAGTDYIQFYKNSNDAWILNNTVAGKIYIKTRPTTSPALDDTIVVSAEFVSVNTSTSFDGNVTVVNTLTVQSTASNSIYVAGGAYVNKSVIVNGNLNVNNTLTVSGNLNINSDVIPVTNNIYDLGSNDYRYRRVYAQSVGTTSTVYYGSLIGTANGLKDAVTFKLQGQITATSFIYSGTSVATTFNTSLMPTAVTSQTSLTTASSTATLLLTEGDSLYKIAKSDFLAGIFPTGMITAFGTSDPAKVPSGWLLCNGAIYYVLTYPALYNILGYTYARPGDGGAFFRVPDMTHSTTASNGTSFISYIIKT